MLNVWKKYSYILFFAFFLLGAIDLRFAVIASICMIGPIVFSFFNGRYWCGNICPRGNFYENILSKVSNKKQVPKWMKSYVFRTLVIVLMFYMFISGIVAANGNLYKIGLVFYRMIVVTSLVGIMFSFIYNHRTWCNFCPMGTIASIITKLRGNKNALYVKPSCVSCKLCSKACPMGVNPYEYKNGFIEHSDCIKCGKCISSCRRSDIIVVKEIKDLDLTKVA
ncbi:MULTISPECIES: 4Fe-4S binding protein [Caloramator]|uniref:4Fe-4S binding domain-containing protein n=1 Tax=Caloramator proteoclasticus DSM 10124 TaxID=1121262 RepID=A0A1M5BW77_9CLOT|nr:MULTISPECIES: 4Fe-4S binding protein [Caloramator]SHF46611.1 4Fe-4S binding domain-containing protein [Caloramator proteoclasticus DSM 10124]